MADIVGSLFGVTPQAVQASMVDPIYEQATKFAQLDPMQRAQQGIYMGGAMLGQGLAGLMGGEDPRLIQARQMQQVKEWIAQNGVDINSPEGLAKAAQYANSIGATEGAMVLGQQSTALRQQQATAMRTEQQAAREEQRFNLEDKLRAELSALPPDATDDQVLAIVRKYGDPTQIMKAIEARTTKMAGEGVMDQAGPVGKAGAYRDTEGNIRGSAEMAKQRAGFTGAQELMNMLNKITVDDVNTAYSPVGVDWTTKEGWQKKLAGAGTVDAQSKIAVAKLEEVINNLPPGAASDADMKQALSGFPGFGDRAALANWINRAKEKIQFILDNFATTYNWKPKVKSSGALDVGQQQQQPQVTQGEWRLK